MTIFMIGTTNYKLTSSQESIYRNYSGQKFIIMPPEEWHPPMSLLLISPTNVCDLAWHAASGTDA
jgi:hypothetical protein